LLLDVLSLCYVNSIFAKKTRRNFGAIWLSSSVGEIIATVIMNIRAAQFRRFRVNDALGGLLGRWVLAFVKLEF